MPQDDEKQTQGERDPQSDTAQDPSETEIRDAAEEAPDGSGPGKPGSQETAAASKTPDPEYDGRIPDAAMGSSDPVPAETPSASGSGKSTTAGMAQPLLFDEDGNPQESDSYIATPESSSGDRPEQGAPTSERMVEPGDAVPDDDGVTVVNPYEVEAPPPEEQPYSYDYYEDSYGDTSKDLTTTVNTGSTTAVTASGAGTPPGDGGSGDGGSGDDEDEDADDDGMLRMSFMEHLEELRTRLIRIVAGLLIAFVVSIVFSPELWKIVQQPAEAALTELGISPPNLTQIQPMEAFNVVYIKLPILSAIFLSSPWILWQVWGFIAPGLYKRERRWAAPFVIVSAGLFITGGLFAYFIAFRFGLTFLLGIGRDINITPMVSITEYFDLFVNVVLAIAIVFELPVLIFFLTLLRIVNPSFLVRNSRYAILGIVILAAIITPTPDVFNLMIFSVPMIVLFFVGVLFSYVLVLHQEGRRFPWKVFYWTMAGLLLILAGILAIALIYYDYQWQWTWPFLIQ